MPDQKTMRTRCLGGFSVMWVTKLLISPVKKGFFAQKPPNLARIWHFWPLLAHSVPCWWVGWWLWRAGRISQDTYLLYCSHGSHCIRWNQKSLTDWQGHLLSCPGQLKGRKYLRHNMMLNCSMIYWKAREWSTNVAILTQAGVSFMFKIPIKFTSQGSTDEILL